MSPWIRLSFVCLCVKSKAKIQGPPVSFSNHYLLQTDFTNRVGWIKSQLNLGKGNIQTHTDFNNMDIPSLTAMPINLKHK